MKLYKYNLIYKIISKSFLFSLSEPKNDKHRYQKSFYILI